MSETLDQKQRRLEQVKAAARAFALSGESAKDRRERLAQSKIPKPAVAPSQLQLGRPPPAMNHQRHPMPLSAQVPRPRHIPLPPSQHPYYYPPPPPHHHSAAPAPGMMPDPSLAGRKRPAPGTVPPLPPPYYPTPSQPPFRPAPAMVAPPVPPPIPPPALPPPPPPAVDDADNEDDDDDAYTKFVKSLELDDDAIWSSMPNGCHGDSGNADNHKLWDDDDEDEFQMEEEDDDDDGDDDDDDAPDTTTAIPALSSPSRLAVDNNAMLDSPADDDDDDDDATFYMPQFLQELEEELGWLEEEDLEAAVTKHTAKSKSHQEKSRTDDADNDGAPPRRAEQMRHTSQGALPDSANDDTAANHVVATEQPRKHAYPLLLPPPTSHLWRSTTTTTTTTTTGGFPHHYPVVTTSQYETLQHLLHAHAQLLLQQSVLTIRTAHAKQQHHEQTQLALLQQKQQQQREQPPPQGRPRRAARPQYQPDPDDDDNNDDDDNIEPPSTARLRAAPIFHETHHDLVDVLDHAVSMLQDLDQHRQDALRRQHYGPARLTRRQFHACVAHMSGRTVFDVPGLARWPAGRQLLDGSVLATRKMAPFAPARPTLPDDAPAAAAAAANAPAPSRQGPSSWGAMVTNELNPAVPRDVDNLIFIQPTRAACQKLLAHVHMMAPAESLLPDCRRDVATYFCHVTEHFGNDFVPPCSDRQTMALRADKTLFTAGEDHLLIRGVNLYGERQWQLVNERFLPDRNVSDILQRYNKLCYLIYQANGVAFDADGDLAPVPKIASFTDIDMTVARELERTRPLPPLPGTVMDHNRWSLPEDLALLRAVPVFGSMWAELKARVLPHRHRAHLRKRYQVLERRVKAAASRRKLAPLPDHHFVKGSSSQRSQTAVAAHNARAAETKCAPPSRPDRRIVHNDASPSDAKADAVSRTSMPPPERPSLLPASAPAEARRKVDATNHNAQMRHTTDHSPAEHPHMPELSQLSKLQDLLEADTGMMESSAIMAEYLQNGTSPSKAEHGTLPDDSMPPPSFLDRTPLQGGDTNVRSLLDDTTHFSLSFESPVKMTAEPRRNNAGSRSVSFLDTVLERSESSHASQQSSNLSTGLQYNSFVLHGNCAHHEASKRSMSDRRNPAASTPIKGAAQPDDQPTPPVRTLPSPRTPSSTIGGARKDVFDQAAGSATPLSPALFRALRSLPSSSASVLAALLSPNDGGGGMSASSFRGGLLSSYAEVGQGSPAPTENQPPAGAAPTDLSNFMAGYSHIFRDNVDTSLLDMEAVSALNSLSNLSPMTRRQASPAMGIGSPSHQTTAAPLPANPAPTARQSLFAAVTGGGSNNGNPNKRHKPST